MAGIVLLLAALAFGWRGIGPRGTSMPAGPAAPPPATSPEARAPETFAPAERPPEPAAPAPVRAAAASPAPSRLRVVTMRPTHRTFNYRDTPIEVEFSQDVNRQTVAGAFKVTPAVEGDFSWPAANRMVFVPRGLWGHGASYLATLERGVTDLTGTENLEPTSWEFSTVTAYLFGRDIRPLLRTDCAPCHHAGGRAARVPLETLQDVTRFVIPGDGDRSRLIKALRDRDHESGLSPHALRRTYRLRDWITVNRAAG